MCFFVLGGDFVSPHRKRCKGEGIIAIVSLLFQSILPSLFPSCLLQCFHCSGFRTFTISLLIYQSTCLCIHTLKNHLFIFIHFANVCLAIDCSSYHPSISTSYIILRWMIYYGYIRLYCHLSIYTSVHASIHPFILSSSHSFIRD